MELLGNPVEWSCINIIRQIFVSGNQIIQRTVQTVRTDLLELVYRQMSLRILLRNLKVLKLYQDFIPFIRPRVINFQGTGFLPNTRVYVFFDKQDVNAFVTPAFK